jgi:hypothetical protein
VSSSLDSPSSLVDADRAQDVGVVIGVDLGAPHWRGVVRSC